MNPRVLNVTTFPIRCSTGAHLGGSTRLVRARYQIPQGALVMGFVGRIVRDKGLDRLTQSWRVLREECPPLHLCCGAFRDQARSRRRGATLRSDPRTIWPEWCTTCRASIARSIFSSYLRIAKAPASLLEHRQWSCP